MHAVISYVTLCDCLLLLEIFPSVPMLLVYHYFTLLWWNQYSVLWVDHSLLILSLINGHELILPFGS